MRFRDSFAFNGSMFQAFDLTLSCDMISDKSLYFRVGFFFLLKGFFGFIPSVLICGSEIQTRRIRICKTVSRVGFIVFHFGYFVFYGFSCFRDHVGVS
jgi:hypothetical protein